MKIWYPFMVFTLWICVGSAQTPVEAWKQKYHSYYQGLSGHKMQVVFNQPKYAVGDTAYFSLFLYENDLTKVAAKRIMEFHLVDAEGNSVHHFLFNVLQGEGNNQWVVPDLPAGVYRVAIHHYGLKAFTPEVIYQQPLEIVRSGYVQPVHLPVRVTVEGGHLIDHVESRIVVSTLPSTSLKLMNASGSVIANGVAGSDGFWSIPLKPSSSQRYFISAATDTTRAYLPATETDGVSLQVKSTDDNHPIAIIKRPSNSKWSDARLTLVVSQRDQVVDAMDVSLAGDSTAIQLETASWREGLIHLAILRPNGEVLTYRNWYHRSLLDSKANMASAKTQYQPREKVDVEVAFNNSKGATTGSFSVTVLTKDLNEGPSWNACHDASFDIDFVNEDFAWNDLRLGNTTTLDNHVLIRSKPQPWARILTEGSPLKDFKFKSNIQRVGTAYNDASKNPAIKGTNLLVYLQQAHQRYQYSITDGLVLMTMMDFYGKDELLVMAETQVYVGGESFGQVIPGFWIDWNVAEIKWPRSLQMKESAKPDPYAASANQNRLIRKSFDAYLTKKEGSQMKGEQQDQLPQADLTVKVTDYEPFVDMEELIREIIPSLQHRKTRKGPIVLVSLPAPMKVTGDPTYIVDGFATKNTTYFMALNPSDIATVSIVSHPKKLLPLGLFGKNGLVIVKTKKGNAREPVNPSLQLDGLSKPLSFGAHHLMKMERSPYFNSSVFWQPLIKTDEQGKATFSFVTSDELGTYQILVRGISKEGIPFTITKEITVGMPTK
jgi:hypothetical protein